MSNDINKEVENTENTLNNLKTGTALNNVESQNNGVNITPKLDDSKVNIIKKITTLDELDSDYDTKNTNTNINTNISSNSLDKNTLEQKKILDKANNAQLYGKIPVIIQEINIFVNVELTKKEMQSGVKNKRYSGSTIITKDIEDLVNMVLLSNGNNNYEFILDIDSKITYNYTQSYDENITDKNSDINVKLIQKEGKYFVDLDSFYKKFKYIIPNNLFPNYLLNGIQNFIKTSKKNTDLEVKFLQEELYYTIKKSQKELNNYNKNSFKKITDFTKKIIIDLEENQDIKRWEKRYKNGINFVRLDTDKNNITYKQINNFRNHTTPFLEIELLSDTLGMEISELRRYIKKVEDITQKKFILKNDLTQKYINKDTYPDKEVLKNLKKSKSLITIDGFFTVLSFIKANNFN